MNTVPTTILSAIITVLAVLMLFYTSVPVGRARQAWNQGAVDDGP
jgi:hypothetical protein